MCSNEAYSTDIAVRVRELTLDSVAAVVVALFVLFVDGARVGCRERAFDGDERSMVGVGTKLSIEESQNQTE